MHLSICWRVYAAKERAAVTAEEKQAQVATVSKGIMGGGGQTEGDVTYGGSKRIIRGTDFLTIPAAAHR